MILNRADSSVSGNSAGIAGGGVRDRGAMIITQSTVTGNAARYAGGVRVAGSADHRGRATRSAAKLTVI